MKQRLVVLDANILLRAVFGTKVRKIMNRFEESAEHYTPELCLGEAQRHLSGISGHRGFPLELSQKILDDLMSGLVI